MMTEAFEYFVAPHNDEQKLNNRKKKTRTEVQEFKKITQNKSSDNMTEL